MGLRHIATRLVSAEVESESALNEKKGWKQFVDEKYEGGSKMVRNPNHETVDRYPKVTVYTALKNEPFRKHLEGEYEQWKGDAEKPEPSDTKNHEDLHKALCGPYTVDNILQKSFAYEAMRMGKLLLDEESIQDNVMPVINQRVKNLSESIATYQQYVKVYSDPISYTQDDVMKNSVQRYLRMVKRYTGVKEVMDVIDPKLIYGLSHYASITQEESIIKFGESWSDSSDNYESLRLHEYVETLGVKGSYADPDEEPSVRITANDKIINDPKTQKDLQEMYTYQQAVFKHLGITHIELYRGVKDTLETEPPSHGDTVSVKTRPLSSWTSNPIVGLDFGKRMIKCKVPVERIFMSPISHPELDGAGTKNNESEYVVMGAEDMDGCTVFLGVG